MFKYGDKVKRKLTEWKGICAPVLEPYTEFKVTAYFADQQYPTVCFKESGSYQWDAAYFELVEEVKNKFAVGDKVISVKATSELPEGFVGYILSDLKAPDFDYIVHDKASDIIGYFNQNELELLSVAPAKKEIELPVKPTVYDTPKPDVINSPKHYSVFESVEAIQVIASSMTQEQFYGYCFGNILKYRLRAGGKDDVMQELGKADKYQELYTEHKHLCKDKE